MSNGPSASESARLLRQRLEMGGREIFLEGLTREEALRLVALARGQASVSATAPRVPKGPRAAEPVGGREEGASVAEARPAAGGAQKVRAATGKTGAATGKVGAAAGKVGAAAGKTGTEAKTPGADPQLAADAPLPDDYDALREVALACTRCRLCEGRTQVVFSDGPRDARLMVVGEAPGANEDQTGVPFVGAAGQYLDLLLSTVGLSRTESVYIANVLKCRPPANRDPKPDEIETCSPYLRKQIDLVRPEALLAVGSFSGKLLTGRDKVSLGKLRGEVHSYHGVPLVVTYHPAALLRNPRWVGPFWDDLQLLRQVLAGGDEAS